MSKKVPIVTMLVVIALTGMLMNCSGNQSGMGVVDSYIGDVTIDGKSASIGQVVKSGSVVKTGADGRVDIVFDGKNILEIFDQADVVLDLTGTNKKIVLNSGSIGHILKNLAKTDDGSDVFEVNTQTAVVAVRGTVFCVTKENADTTYACCCNGTIILKDPDGSNQNDVTSAHHTAFRYTMMNGKVIVSKAGLEHHSDAVLDALASKINYKIDWTKPD